MEQIIKYLVIFVNQHELPESFVEIEKDIGKRDLRVIAITLLDWLKAQYHCKRKSPLKLNMEYTWCKNLIQWYNTNDELKKFFKITKNILFDFSDSVTEDERESIRYFIDESYNPPFMS
jgi:hypothetical protein